MNKQTIDIATSTLAKKAGSWNPVNIQIHVTEGLTWIWVLPGDRQNGRKPICCCDQHQRRQDLQPVPSQRTHRRGLGRRSGALGSRRHQDHLGEEPQLGTNQWRTSSDFDSIVTDTSWSIGTWRTPQTDTPLSGHDWWEPLMVVRWQPGLLVSLLPLTVEVGVVLPHSPRGDVTSSEIGQRTGTHHFCLWVGRLLGLFVVVHDTYQRNALYHLSENIFSPSQILTKVDV